MTLADFFQRFRDNQEIGRDSTAERLAVYYDNGQDVGRVVEHRPSTRCVAEILTPENALIARHWCDRTRSQKGERPHQEAERG
jgi:hypothetical protein